MYTYYIVRAGQIPTDPRIAKSITSFGYSNDDVICIAQNGYVNEMQTVRTAQVTLNDFTDNDIDSLAQKLIDSKTETNVVDAPAVES